MTQHTLFDYINTDLMSKITSYLTETDKFILSMALNKQLRDPTPEEIRQAIEIEEEFLIEEADIARYMDEMEYEEYNEDFTLYDDWEY